MRRKQTESVGKTRAGYTEWQIRRLRARLLSYRLLSSVDGVYYSVLLLAIDIEESLPRNHADDPEVVGLSKDRNFKIKQERLRIFLAGGVLDGDKLVIIKKFLINEGMLNEAEFKEADNTKEFLATFRFIGSESPLTTFRLERLPLHMVCTRDQLSTTAILQLQIQRDPSGLFFRAVETLEEQITAGPPFDDVLYDKDGHTAKRYCKFGYGFTATESSRIHIFLLGENPHLNVTYLEVNAQSLDVNLASYLFVRYGDSTGLPVESLSGIHEVVYDLKIFEFKPAGHDEKRGKPK